MATRSGLSRPLSSSSAITSHVRLAFVLLLAATLFSSCSLALQHVAGGPCESVCANDVAGTVHDDVVCLDNQFDNAPGSLLKRCATCQLNSTAVDTNDNITDVDWALFNLRYTLSNCMFAYPEERVSISSPCQVSCAPLQTAITHGIQNSTNATDFSADLGFCTSGRFDDTTINNCAFCYSFIPEQLFLGNFLQALHIACHSPPQSGKTFYPDGVAIFNRSAIAGPAPATSGTPGGGGLSGSKLIVAIVIPLVVGIALIIGICVGCWHFTRKRRTRMAASGRMSKFHDSKAYSPVTPQTYQNQWNEPAREMETMTVMPKMSDSPITKPPIQKNSPGVAQGRWTHQNEDEAGTPLQNTAGPSWSRNEMGPTGQMRDPMLHEQYLGGDSESRPASGVWGSRNDFARVPVHGSQT